jgi:hypothetical protein
MGRLCDPRHRFGGVAVLGMHVKERGSLALVFGTPNARRSLAEHAEVKLRGRRVACRRSKPLISLPLELAVPDRSLEVSRG